MATGNPWYSAAETTLPQYVPLPFQELMAAGQAIQNRYDTNIAAMDSAAQGIASIETRLPGHQQYVADFAKRFQEETEELLSRYNNNVADPQFAREFTRLRSRYANDPNLRTILNANAAYDANQKIRQKLMESGQRFIDTTRGITGLNPDGTLSADVGTIRATNFESDLHDMYQDTLKATINDFGGRISNEQAVGMVTESLLSEGANNPILREAMEYYMSQGATPEQAQEQLLKTLQREAASALTIDRDGSFFTNQLGWANYGLARQKFDFDQAKELAKQNRAGAMIALSSPLEVRNLNENLIKEADAVLRGSSGGNMPFRAIPDTPENRAKYPNAERISGGSAGTGAAGTGPLLRITNEQARQAGNEFVESAREEISHILQAKGINPQTATNEQVLNNYKEYLKADNNAPTFWTTPVAEIRDNITSQYFGAQGQNLGDAIIENRKGDITRVAGDKKALEDLKGFDFTGITTSPVRRGGQEFANGAIKGTAVDSKGNIVTIYKPLPPMLQQSIPVSLTVDRALTSGLTNKQLREDPSFRVLGRNIVPQKRSGRISFFEVDNSGNIVGDEFNPEQIQQILQSEKQAISQYFSLHQNTD